MINTKKIKQGLITISQKEWMMFFLIFVISFIINIILTPKSTKIATVDIVALVNEFVKEQTRQNLPAKSLQKNIYNFGKKLQTTLDEVAKKKQVILMPKEAVISGGEDLTSLMRYSLQKNNLNLIR